MAVLMVLKGNYTAALYAVISSGIFDFFDGMVARWLHVKSLIGKELDSLADMVSFGFLPGVVLYSLLQQATTNVYVPYIGFFVTVFSALRLAKFNIDERQTADFIGVNTPMNTFLIISFPFIAQRYPEVILNPYFLVVFAIVSGLLLVSELRLFAMKLNSLAWSVNKFKYLFLLSSGLSLILFNILALPIVFVLYILFSVIHYRFEKKGE